MELNNKIAINKALNANISLAKSLSKAKGAQLQERLKTLSDLTKIPLAFLVINSDKIQRMAYIIV